MLKDSTEMPPCRDNSPLSIADTLPTQAYEALGAEGVLWFLSDLKGLSNQLLPLIGPRTGRAG